MFAWDLDAPLKYFLEYLQLVLLLQLEGYNFYDTSQVFQRSSQSSLNNSVSIYHFINNLEKNIEINLFYVTDQYTQKTSENLWFSDIFRGYRKKTVAWNW